MPPEERRERNAAAQRRWRAAHPEQALANARRWRKENREHVNDLSREWQREHRDERNAKARERYATDPVPRRRSQQTFYEAHPERRAAYREAHREERAAYDAERWRAMSVETRHEIAARSWRRTGRLSRYGVSAEQFAEMVEKQDGRCAICGEVFAYTGRWDRPNLDHDHQTDAVRGLLCHHCNTMLGFARDSLDVLEAAVNYMRSYK